MKPGMTGSWADDTATAPDLRPLLTPHAQWHPALVFLACAALFALALLTVDLGRALMCNAHSDAPPSYCPAYAEEPTP